MLFRSTRGAMLDMTFEEVRSFDFDIPRSLLTFQQAVFEGLAQDGGLLVPHYIPDCKDVYKEWRNLSFHELAYEIASR
jgi:hypothetical protein